MPYGPVYDPAQPYDGIERGLLGYFINSNIENQYEFVLSQWVNDSEFAGAVRLHPKSKDPMIGTQDPAESIFVIPQPDGAPSDQADRIDHLRDHEGGRILFPAECHRHQVHRAGQEIVPVLFLTKLFGVTDQRRRAIPRCGTHLRRGDRRHVLTMQAKAAARSASHALPWNPREGRLRPGAGSKSST